PRQTVRDDPEKQGGKRRAVEAVTPAEKKENVRDQGGNDQDLVHPWRQGLGKHGNHTYRLEQGRTRAANLDPLEIVRGHQAEGKYADQDPEHSQPRGGRFREPELIEKSEESIHGPTSVVRSPRAIRQEARTCSVMGVLFPAK